MKAVGSSESDILCVFRHKPDWPGCEGGGDAISEDWGEGGTPAPWQNTRLTEISSVTIVEGSPTSGLEVPMGTLSLLRRTVDSGESPRRREEGGKGGTNNMIKHTRERWRIGVGSDSKT